MKSIHNAAAVIVILSLLLCWAAYCSEEGAQEDGKKSLGASPIVPPSPVWVIGSYDKDGKPNVMTASWVGVCCSRPPCVAVSLREATHTFGNIKESGAYTVNIPSVKYAREAAFFGSVSGKEVDKFSATGLTPVRSELVNAPYIGEFPLVVECELVKTVELGLHTMFIGEIKDVKAEASILQENGLPDSGKLKPFFYSFGSGDFYGIGGSIGAISDLKKEIEK